MLCAQCRVFGSLPPRLWTLGLFVSPLVARKAFEVLWRGCSFGRTTGRDRLQFIQLDLFTPSFLCKT